MYQRNSYSIKISKAQIKVIYTLAQELGLVDKMAGTDELHLMIQSIAGRDHVSDLTNDEANTVITRLKASMRGASRARPQTKRENMASDGEIRLIWALIYKLRSFDAPDQSSNLQKRLRGFLKKYAGIDDIKFLTHEKANSVIEGLKGLVANEKRKTQRKVDVNG
jgi:hypothetical protein